MTCTSVRARRTALAMLTLACVWGLVVPAYLALIGAGQAAAITVCGCVVWALLMLDVLRGQRQ